jgi:branched-chain amino acid transport system ATP-binding protein
MSSNTGVSLEAVDVTVRYGGVVANENIRLRADPGRIVGLIGPNGAGKTSFIDALTGFARSSGTVSLGGVRLDGMTPHMRKRAGMSRTWQAGELFSSLSVRDNVRVAAEKAGWRSITRDFLRQNDQSNEDAIRTLGRVGLEGHADDLTEDLSLGLQKLVGVARALVGNPSVVLLDEPAAGLDTRESKALGRRLRGIVEGGPALLLIDHDMDLVFDICETVYVLDFGRVIASGPPEEVRADERVLAAYLGATTTREEHHGSAGS